MAIELSSLTFTNWADVVPPFGVEEILINTGVTNTLAGKDILTGITTTPYNYAFVNSGTLNTAEGDDAITGIADYVGIVNSGTLNTAEGNDIITTDSQGPSGIYNTGTFNTGKGNDIINAKTGFGVGLDNNGTFNTAEGDDIINGRGYYNGISNGSNSIFDTGDGNDIIRGNSEKFSNFPTSGISNYSSTFNTGDGNDIIDGTGYNGIYNRGIINTGSGKDIITGKGSSSSSFGNGTGIYNFGTINTGNDDDIITSTAVSYEGDVLKSIIFNDGTIDTGNGKDFIIAEGGFDGTGSVFLGNGQDYLKGFGTGNFNGGNAQDALELTSGSYTVGILGTTVNFTKGSTVMNTSEFEILIAGNTVYNFASLTNGQIITVAQKSIWKYGTANYEKSFAVLKEPLPFTDNSFILFLDLAVVVSSRRWGNFSMLTQPPHLQALDGKI